MTHGFIKLHRKILNWEWFNDDNTFRLFMYCLLRANHTNTKWRGIVIKKGSFLTSLPTLSKETSLSVQNIRTSINKLKSTGEITDKTTNKNRIISVVNWNLYQNTNRQTNRQLTDNQQTTNRQLTADKKEKNKKNDNNDKNKSIDVGILFEEFWKFYQPVNCNGRTVGKGSKKVAREKYAICLKAEKHENIIKGLEAYLFHCAKNSQLTCSVPVFLNQERWKNEYGVSIIAEQKQSDKSQRRRNAEMMAKELGIKMEEKNVRQNAIN